MSGCRVLARHVKIHHRQSPSRLQEFAGVFQGGKPIGNHRQGIRKRDDIGFLAREFKQDHVLLMSADVGPPVSGDTVAGDCQEGTRQINHVNRAQAPQAVAEALQVGCRAATHLDPDPSLRNRQFFIEFLTAPKQVRPEGVVAACLARVERFEPRAVIAAPNGGDGQMIEGSQIADERHERALVPVSLNQVGDVKAPIGADAIVPVQALGQGVVVTQEVAQAPLLAP